MKEKKIQALYVFTSLYVELQPMDGSQVELNSVSGFYFFQILFFDNDA